MLVMARGARGEKAVGLYFDTSRCQRVPKLIYCFIGAIASPMIILGIIFQKAKVVLSVSDAGLMRVENLSTALCAGRLAGNCTVASAAVTIFKTLYEIERDIGEAPTEERFSVRQ